MKNKYKISTAVLFMLVLMIFPCIHAQAETNGFVAGLGVSAEYSDNLLFTRIDPKKDIYGSVEPSLSYNYLTEAANISSSAGADVVRYKKYSELDYVKQDYSLKGSFNISERFDISAGLSYIDDMTQEGELTEAGEVTAWQKRRNYAGETGIGFMMSERAKIGVSYSYLKKKFEGRDSINYDRQAISMTCSGYFNSGLDVVSLAPQYEYRDSVQSRLDNYSVSLSWRHSFSETSYVNLSAGGRSTKEDYGNGLIVMKDKGWIGSAGFNRKTETAVTEVGYSRELHTNVTGGETEVDQFFITVNKNITTRFSAGMGGRLYLRQQLYGTQGYRDKYYVVSSALSYNITENNSLSLGYRFAGQSADYYFEDKTRQNSLWLSLQFKFS